MIKKNILFSLLIMGTILFLITSSCRKEIFTNNSSDRLIFSKDTLQFDTIFTNIGSATRYFVVKNPNKSRSINIDRIYVAKQSQSKYNLNINGKPANSIDDVVIAPGDSIHIFVMVKIDPNRDQMIEQDSVVFLSNGNTQDVKLISYGQDVTLIKGHIIRNDTSWTSHKPVLIYNSALVDTLATLTIEPGTKVYFHKGSSLLVCGTLKVNGETNNRVLFTGDRLESYYGEIPGQWGAYNQNSMGQTTAIFGGIHLFESSHDNFINNADIKNSIIGLQVSSNQNTSTPTLILKNTNIENSQVAGLYSIGAHIEAENCVFANSGQYNVGCMVGGKYNFIHCTMANYWSGNRQTPQLLLNNYGNLNIGGQNQLEGRDLQASFGNCILYGSREDEIKIDGSDQVGMDLEFTNSLIRYKDTVSLKEKGLFTGNIFNENPKFKNTRMPYDYQLDTLSPAKDKGKLSIGQLVPFDQLGINRVSDGKPDIGAYERRD